MVDKAEVFSLSITNSNRPQWAHLISQEGASFDSNILALLARPYGQSEWVIFVCLCFFYLSEIGKEFLGNRMNESISLRFQPRI